MSKELTTKLQGIIKQAAQTLPAQTGKVAAQQAKIDRRRGQAVILADVSDSMQDLVGESQRKIDILREAVTVARSKSSARLMVFSDQAREVESIPEPEANTNLTAGLKAALAHDPGVTLVISDGQPDRPDEALAIARQFRGVIDVLYIGPDSDLDAIAFMRRLAAAAGGGVTMNDVAKEDGARSLAGRIIGLLPLL